MYKILGADGKEYGPVTREQIGAWIREGRANALTQVQVEGGTAWQALGSFPEFAEFLAVPIPPLSPDDLGPRSAKVDIGYCLSRSWNLFKTNPALMIGAALIVLLIMGAVEVLISRVVPAPPFDPRNFRFSPELATAYLIQSLPGMVIYPVLYTGLYGLALKLIRGQPASLADIFLGFQSRPFQIAVASILISFLTAIGILCCLIPGIYLSVAWIFTYPLIMDKGLSAWRAMEYSRATITRNWFGIFCLLLVASALLLGGALACCVGILVGGPVALCMMMYAYEDIFSSPG